ncbi:MAG: radical SAM protein [Candidatus Thorarchaeota archaeon]|nr:MAG: radical SAM protein [Candidatus Thorarchaeota archaeon]RLI59548.1 MAG: radical SAM protein [Candidatus Thorarchaeota archaeon]
MWVLEMDAEEILRLKVRLLTEGATLPQGEWSGRRGGAGPVGGRYFVLPNGRPCGIPIRMGENAERYNSAPLVPTDEPGVWLYDGNIRLREVPRPKFYDLKTGDGTPYHKIALLHGDGTVATTVYQACRYWFHGTQCKFCTIPLSYRTGDSVLEKVPAQIAEVVLAAEEEGVAKDVLLTTGTPESDDMGIERLVSIIEAIREVSEIPIGVQFEPPVDRHMIKLIADAGANAVGMHIESADEAVREKMCPGKYEYGPLDLYTRSWQYALDFFDRGNVSTFILHGLGEDIATTLSLVDELAQVGVLPVVAPVRPAPGSQLEDFTPTYMRSVEDSVEFYKKVGAILFANGLNPSETLAGCHKCGGCTADQEAYDWASSQ